MVVLYKVSKCVCVCVSLKVRAHTQTCLPCMAAGFGDTDDDCYHVYYTMVCDNHCPYQCSTPATNKLLKRGFLRTNERNVNISDISSPTSSAISLFATHLQTHLSTTTIVTLIVIIALTMDVTIMGPSSSASCASASVRVHTRYQQC